MKTHLELDIFERFHVLNALNERLNKLALTEAVSPDYKIGQTKPEQNCLESVIHKITATQLNESEHH